MTRLGALVLTCEHGGNQVPKPYRHLFASRTRLLRSHRAYDAGALDLARFLARHTGAPLLACTTTRLLVDSNRSPRNPRAFSEISRVLDRGTRRDLMDDVHAPHWSRVERALRTHMRQQRAVLHVAVHSFTPVLRGVRRPCDVGLLYDPARPLERLFCTDWRLHLRALSPHLRVRRNYPYRGSDDGLTTAMRRRFDADRYLGIEIEINQAWWSRHRPDRWHGLRRQVLASLQAAMGNGQ